MSFACDVFSRCVPGSLGLIPVVGCKVASRKQREAAKKAAKSEKPLGVPTGDGGAPDATAAKPSEAGFTQALELRESESDGESFSIERLRKQIIDSDGTGTSLREKALNDLLHSKLTLIPASDGVTWSLERNCWVKDGKPIEKEPPKGDESEKSKRIQRIQCTRIRIRPNERPILLDSAGTTFGFGWIRLEWPLDSDGFG